MYTKDQERDIDRLADETIGILTRSVSKLANRVSYPTFTIAILQRQLSVMKRRMKAVSKEA